ncbi:MAG: PGF-pre-PGF domain-containing protein [Nanoarchaeota archaeon]|nr:PGF-pre-PGF domain-containing protein [Nanoarchaeota archaeon]
MNSTPVQGYAVSKAESSLVLTLNGSQSNYTIMEGVSIDINATRTSGEGSLTLYLEGILLDTDINITNNQLFASMGEYNVTAMYAATENYSSSEKTYFVTVLDSNPPQLTINNALGNDSVISNSSYLLNITTNEKANCTGYLCSIGSCNSSTMATTDSYKHTATLYLSSQTYDINISCIDLTQLTGNASMVNISVDRSSPAISFTSPSSGSTENAGTVDINYTIVESHLDKAWIIRNSNSTKFYTSGGGISMAFAPGLQSITLYANDTVGNIGSSSLTFYVNATLSPAQWVEDISSRLGASGDVQLLNSSNLVPSAIDMGPTVTIEINLTDSQLMVPNFTAQVATWEFYFDVDDDDAQFESDISSSIGETPLEYVIVSNFTGFIPQDSDYYGRMELPGRYDYLYYCSGNTSTCGKITSSCSGTYTIASATACYVLGNDSVIYVPHFSSVFGINDTTYPALSVLSPANHSVQSNSVFYLNFTVNETNPHTTTFCNYTLNNGTDTHSDLDIDTADLTATGTLYIGYIQLYNVRNGNYNLTISCKDLKGQATTKKLNISVVDTVRPVITSTEPEDDDISTSSESKTVALGATTDERSICKYHPSNVVYASMSTYLGSSSSYSLTHTEDITYDSDSDESYYIACVDINNVETLARSHVTYTVDVGSGSTGGGSDDDDDSGSSGGGGGGTGGNTNPEPPARSTQVWRDMAGGAYTFNIPSLQIAFTNIFFSVPAALEGTSQLTVERVDSVDFSQVPFNLYQYLKVDRTNLEGITGITVKFRVPKAWISSKKIDPDSVRLFRYTDTWDMLTTKKLTNDSQYIYYESQAPGFSYFAISGQLAVESPIVPEPQKPPTGNVIVPTDDNGGEEETEEETESTSSGLGWLWFLFVLIIISGAIGGFFYYQRSVSVLSDKELNDLRVYVSKCKEEGVEFSNIKEALRKVGWSEDIITLVMHDVHVPSDEIDKLAQYIKTMKAKRVSDTDIENNLKKVGWSSDLIAEARKKIK